MFPLGSVLFPAMPLALRVFEERYLAMLAEVLREEPSEFGVVLIERGQEVGGGERRFEVGTVARIVELEGADGFVALLAQGTRRFRVVEWLADDPYPRARVEWLDDVEWDEALAPVRARVEREVRRALAVGTEFGDVQYSSAIELEGNPVDAAWQLAAVAPLNELDQLRLLRVGSLLELFEELGPMAVAASETFRVASELEALDTEDEFDDDSDDL